MSAFGSGGSDDFEEEEGHVETPYEQKEEAAPSNFDQFAPKPPASAALSSSASAGPGALSGESSAFDDEDDYSSPLHQAAIAKYAEAANVSIARPKEETLFAQAPPSLTISNGRDVMSKVNLNPLQSSASTGAQPNASASAASNPLAASSAQSLHPSAHSSLPRIHSSPATYDDSKTALEALWAGQAATDPALFTHAVYSRQTHFGKGEVHVTDPEKKGDGITSYIVYKVKSAIEHSEGHTLEALVSRRYSDFLWLHEHLFLNAQLAGFLVPPIPNKAVVGRFAEDFVEERRRSLEMFIKRIVAHPILRETEQARVFLQGTDVNMAAARKQKVKQIIPGLKAATEEGGVLSIFSGAFASKAVHERSPDDTLCEKADDYALKLEQELTNLEGQLEMLMRREKNVARTWVELGMACGVVSQMEAAVNERVNVSVFQVLGSMSDQVAVMVARKVEMERQGFTDCVKDHIRMAQAVQTMMKLRGVVAHNFYEQFARVEQLQRKAAKDPNAAKQVADGQTLLNQRQAELLEVTNRARVEFGRFQKEKAKALKQAVIHFVRLQIDHARQAQAAWENVLPDLENLP